MNGQRRVVLVLLFLVSIPLASLALTDPPGRVARIQYLDGSVSIQPEGKNDWTEAVLNRPLTTADNVWADKDSRAELNVGTGVLRIGSETSLTLTNVSNNSVQLRLHQGTLNLHVRKLYDGEVYEVDAPNLAFLVQKSGDYRFDVDSSGEITTVTVWRGEGEATGEGRSVRLKGSERARFAEGASMAHTLSMDPKPDGFDDWCAARDERQDKSASARYVSPEVIGSEDLDYYGRWETAPTYGAVWVPYVSAGWVPYRYGRWVWISPWGWTWVDNAQWGFAPFHYGRWVYYNGYWGWAPGAYLVRPYYSPALVAWFGGNGWGVSFGYGGGVYGWCALGWGEPYYPWYHHGYNYYRHVNYNVTNIYVINNHYRDGHDGHGHWGSYANRNHGFSAMDGRELARGASVDRHIANVPPRQLAQATPLGGNMSLRPTTEGRLRANASSPMAAPHSAFGPRGTSGGNVPVRGSDISMRAAGSQVGGRSVPRPSAVGNSFAGSRSAGTFVRANNNVPRPPSGFNSGMHSSPRGAESAFAPGEAHVGRASFGGSSGGDWRSVPRPTGPVMRPASGGYGESFRGGSAYAPPSTSGGSETTSRGGGSSPRSYSYAGGASYGGGGYSPRVGPYSSSGGGGYSAPRSYGAPSSSFGGGGHVMSTPSGGGYSGVPRGGGSSGGGHVSGGNSGSGHAGGSGGFSVGGGGHR